MDFDHPEHLLDHGQLVRSLASALVNGPADVDDVVQGTYAAALTTKRPAGFPLPRWLLGVARNVARRSHRERRRRTQRELLAARPEALRSTAEVVEFEELRRLVVAAVLELGEPYRSAVLLRYYDGLPPREIARRLGMPAATVRSHLHRALGQLQQRLDRDWRGGRAAWTALLLPLAQVPALPAGGTVTMTTKIVLSTALVAATALLWQTVRAPSLASEQIVAATPSGTAPPAANAAVADAATRTLAAAHPASTPDEVAAPRALLRFLDGDGKALGGDALRMRFESSRTRPIALLLDADVLERGGVEGIVATLLGEPTAWQRPCGLRIVDGGGEVADLPSTGRFRLLVPRPHAPAHLTEVFAMPAQRPLAFDVPLPRAEPMRTLRFVAADTGALLAEATVCAYTEFGDDRAFVPGTTMTTDASGEATLTDAVAANPYLIRPAWWWLDSKDHAGRFALTGDAEVRVPRRGRIAGEAVAMDGSAAAGRTVVFTCHKGPPRATLVAADGHFEIADLPATSGAVFLLGATVAELQNDEATVPPGGTASVHLGPARGANGGGRISGRITAGGRPVGGVMATTMQQNKGQLAQSAADGSYVLEHVAPGAGFSVWLGDPDVSDDFRIERKTPLAFAPDAPTVFDFDLPRGCLAVRVLDEATGQPLEGVAVQARPAQDGVQRDRFPGFTFRAGWAARTDAQGEVLLRALPEGEPHIVRVGGHGFTTKTIDLRAPALDENVERIVVRVRRQ